MFINYLHLKLDMLPKASFKNSEKKNSENKPLVFYFNRSQRANDFFFFCI